MLDLRIKSGGDISFLHQLRCPFCGGTLNRTKIDQVAIETDYGVLTCYCSQYPMVAGIPVLKRGIIGAAGQTTNDVVAMIRAGQYLDALLSFISPASPALAPPWIRSLPSTLGIRRLKRLAHEKQWRRWRERATSLLRNRGGETTACEVFDLCYCNNKRSYDYFVYRFGQPRHLVALSFTTIIPPPDKPILDLACGCGHITRSLVQRSQGNTVIGLDSSFFELYVAKHWIAPEAEYVCCAADAALPFSDSVFSAAFCSDAFHYFLNKRVCFRELERVTNNDGVIILVWMHNALVRRPPGVLPLPPQGYQALAGNLPHRLVADKDVLQRYVQRRGPALSQTDDIRHLADTPRLSLVATRRQELFRDHGRFEEWPHAYGQLGLNPLFVAESENVDGSVRLKRRFPSVHYEEEHVESREYLPQMVEVPVEILTSLECGKKTPQMENLIDQCVLLGIPEKYLRREEKTLAQGPSNSQLPIRALSAF